MLECLVSMQAVLRHLGWVACVWLSVQLSVITATSASLFTRGGALTTAASCTCANGDTAQCPMHHHTPPSKSNCACHSTAPDASTAAVMAMLGQAGVLTGESSAFTPPQPSAFASASTSVVTSWIVSPDGPPPRA